MSETIFKILRFSNLILTVVVCMLAAYIILIPSLPEIVYVLTPDEFSGYVYNSAKSREVLGGKAAELPQIPDENRLVIPSIMVNAPVIGGYEESALNLGMWHIPATSSPILGGNTVIAGHRFLHRTGGNTLYNLDKVKLNDTILVYWQSQEYVYKVFEIIEVYPQQIDIEYNTPNPILTVYTCTPLDTSEKRLVVKASLQS